MLGPIRPLMRKRRPTSFANRKYTMYRNAARERMSHYSRGQNATKIWRSLDVWFLRYARAPIHSDRQACRHDHRNTSHTYTAREVKTLLSICTPRIHAVHNAEWWAYTANFGMRCAQAFSKLG